MFGVVRVLNGLPIFGRSTCILLLNLAFPDYWFTSTSFHKFDGQLNSLICELHVWATRSWNDDSVSAVWLSAFIGRHFGWRRRQTWADRHISELSVWFPGSFSFLPTQHRLHSWSFPVSLRQVVTVLPGCSLSKLCCLFLSLPFQVTFKITLSTTYKRPPSLSYSLLLYSHLKSYLSFLIQISKIVSLFKT